jgi:hypothetical protein
MNYFLKCINNTLEKYKNLFIYKKISKKVICNKHSFYFLGFSFEECSKSKRKHYKNSKEN